MRRRKWRATGTLSCLPPATSERFRIASSGARAYNGSTRPAPRDGSAFHKPLSRHSPPQRPPGQECEALRVQQWQNQQGGSFHAFSWRSSRGRHHGHLHGQHGEHWYHHPACCARGGPLVICGRTLLAATEVVTCGCLSSSSIASHSLDGGHQGSFRQGVYFARVLFLRCFATATTRSCVLQVETRASDWRDLQSTLQCTDSTHTQQQGATRTHTLTGALDAPSLRMCNAERLAASQLITHVSTGRFPGPERQRQQNRLSKNRSPTRIADQSSLLWPPNLPAEARK